jgi:hypothetical protein
MADITATSGDFQTDLAFDLRMARAFVLANHLQKIMECKFARDFSAWFNILQDTWVDIEYKLRPQDKEEYLKLRQKVIDLSNTYVGVYTKKAAGDSKGKTLLTYALYELETFIYAKMDKAKFFGEKYIDHL